MPKMFSDKKIFYFAASLVAIFIMAVAVWYSPILFKGYTSTTLASHALVRAKNFSDTGIYATESDLNVILAPSLVAAEGNESSYGNKMGTLLYSYVIKYFGVSSNATAVLVNSIILALALVFFGFVIFYLFDLKTLWLFSLIYIFLPSNWSLPQLLVGYEFSLLFLSLFFLFFTVGTKKFSKDFNNDFSRTEKLYLLMAGSFLALSALSREAMFLLLPILLIFLFVVKLKKYILYIFIPTFIILSLFWLPDFFAGKNTYLLFFSSEQSENLKGGDYSFYSHLFPDPYTYHFNQAEYLAEFSDLEDTDALGRVGVSKVLANMGFGSVSLSERVVVGTPLLARHLFRLFSVTEIGGPFIFLLLFLGLLVLKRQRYYWYSFYLTWFLGSIFLLSYLSLAGRNHLMDFGWAIAIAATLGLILLSNSLSSTLYSGKYKNIITVFLLLVVIYNLILTGHVMWGNAYDNSLVPIISSYSQAIEKSDINNEDIIALPLDANDAYNINFHTDNSLVVFRKETIRQLLAANELAQVFTTFNVKYVLGYSPELTEKIVEQTGLVSIAENNIEVSYDDIKINNKNWFLNLVK